MSNLDHQIKQLGDNFSVEPRPQVWERLEAELDKTSRRQPAGWWWMAPLLLLIGAGIFYLALPVEQWAANGKIVSNDTAPEKAPPLRENNPSAVNSIKPIKGSLPHEKTTTGLPDGYRSAKATATPPFITPNTSKNATSLAHAGRPDTVTLPTTDQPVSTASLAAQSAALDAVPLESSPTGRHGEPVEQLSLNGYPGENHPALSSTRSGVDPLVENVQTLAADRIKSDSTEFSGKTVMAATGKPALPVDLAPDNVVEKDSTAPQVGATATGIISSRKNTWRVGVDAGIANNSRYHLSFLDAQKEYASADPLNNSTGVPTNALAIPTTLNRPGLSLSAWLRREQWFSNRWQWVATANVQYQQVMQQAGVRRDSAVSANTYAQYSADNYYLAGKTNTIKGTNYRASVSGEIAFSILKKRPALFLRAGLYTGLNFYDSYLVPDVYTRRYVQADVYQKFFAGSVAGLDYRFKNGLSIGVTTRQDFTKSFEPMGGKDQYWHSYLLTLGMPLNR